MISDRFNATGPDQFPNLFQVRALAIDGEQQRINTV